MGNVYHGPSSTVTEPMPKTFHYIRVRVMCNATEDEDLIAELMESLVDPERIEVSDGEGHHGNRLLMFEAELKSNKDHRRLFEALGPGAVGSILDELDERMDEENSFYLRFDKQKAVGGVWELARHGDVFMVSGKVETHPVDRNQALSRMRAFLSGLTADDKVD